MQAWNSNMQKDKAIYHSDLTGMSDAMKVVVMNNALFVPGWGFGQLILGTAS